MKKLLLLATVLIGLTAGCKKSTIQPTVEPTLLTTWRISHTIKTDYTVTPKHSTINFVTNRDDTYIFKSDGTGKSTSGSASITLKFQLNGSALKLTYDLPSNQVLNYNISELTLDKLVLLESTEKDNTGKILTTNETSYIRVQ